MGYTPKQFGELAGIILAFWLMLLVMAVVTTLVMKWLV